MTRWMLAALVALGLGVLAVSYAASSGPYRHPVTASAPASATPTGSAQPAQATPETDTQRQQEETNRQLAQIGLLQGVTLLYVLTIVVVLLIGVVFVIGYVRDGRRGRSPRGSPQPPPGQPSPRSSAIAEAVDDALAAVEQGETREAVVACWLLLQRAGAAAGTMPQGSQTAAEYAQRLAEEQAISERPLARLAELYREARFSRHEVSDELRAQARWALGVLQAELGSGVRW